VLPLLDWLQEIVVVDVLVVDPSRVAMVVAVAASTRHQCHYQPDKNISV
jgi:hypothetical protein